MSVSSLPTPTIPNLDQFYYYVSHPGLTCPLYKMPEVAGPWPVSDSQLYEDVQKIYAQLLAEVTSVSDFQSIADLLRSQISSTGRISHIAELVSQPLQVTGSPRSKSPSPVPIPKPKKAPARKGRKGRRAAPKKATHEPDHFVMAYPKGGSWPVLSDDNIGPLAYDLARMKSFKCLPPADMYNWFGNRHDLILVRLLAPDLMKAVITKTDPTIELADSKVVQIQFCMIVYLLSKNNYRVAVSTDPATGLFCPESHIYQIIFYLIFACVVSGRDRNVMLRTLLSLVKPNHDYDRIIEAVLSYARPTMLASLATHRNLVGPIFAQELLSANYKGSFNNLLRAKIYSQAALKSLE